MIIPLKLQKGNCIGIFSPAGPIRDTDKVKAGIDILNRMGFEVKISAHLEPGEGYLANDDQSRVNELHSLLQDKDVHALMALRGGYGCLRIADLIDFGIIEKSQKLIVGFSDVSILLNLINNRSGLVTVHGPVLTSLASTDKASRQSLHEMFENGLPKQIKNKETVIVRPGAAKGTLRGGNLATLIHLLGTPWEINWDETVLMLEDTGEPMYKIDRMLTQLYYSGRLAKLAGIILGDFDTGEPDKENDILQEQVWQRTIELTAEFDYPVWGNFPVGHRKHNQALPLGLEVTMKSKPATLTFHNA